MHAVGFLIEKELKELDIIKNETWSINFFTSSIFSSSTKVFPTLMFWLFRKVPHIAPPISILFEVGNKFFITPTSLGDVFVLDAFGSAHRAHASTYGISEYLLHAVVFFYRE